MKILTTILALTFTTQAVAADQFDLKCKGEVQWKINETPKPKDFGLRIDLAANKWCWSHCEIIYDIAEVHPDRIVFQDEKHDTFQRKETRSAYVSRVDGSYRAESIEIKPFPSYYKRTGMCTVAPFSGFPKTKF